MKCKNNQISKGNERFSDYVVFSELRISIFLKSNQEKMFLVQGRKKHSQYLNYVTT